MTFASAALRGSLGAAFDESVRRRVESLEELREFVACAVPVVAQVVEFEDAPLAQDYPAAPVLNKPYTADHLRKALAGLRL